MLDEQSRSNLARAAELVSAGAFREALALCESVAASNPTAPEPHVVAADIQLRLKAPDRALHAIQIADRHAPPTPFVDALRAVSLLELRDVGGALEAAHRAASAQTGHLPTLLSVGQVFGRIGRFEAALSCFRAAYALNPRRSAIHLAAQLHLNGELDEAEARYREIVASDPRQPVSWFSLTQLRKDALSSAEIAQLERLASEEPSLDNALIYAHAIAKALEDRGEYLRAAAVLDPIKKRKKREIHYDFESSDRLVFDAALTVNPLPQQGYPSGQPIFVIGMPRSGTTVVERIMASHPKVASISETVEFAVAIRRAAGMPVRGPYDAEMIAAGARADPYQVGANYVRAINARVKEKADRIIDKMPINFFLARLIHAALPNARIVCVRRGSMDTCIANYSQWFGAVRYSYQFDLEDVAREYVAFDQLAAFWRAVLPSNRYTELRYEDLIADQEGETRRLLAFCGLSWDERCLAFHQHGGSATTASTVQVRQPLHSSSVGRWRRYGGAIEPALAVLRAVGIDPDHP